MHRPILTCLFSDVFGVGSWPLKKEYEGNDYSIFGFHMNATSSYAGGDYASMIFENGAHLLTKTSSSHLFPMVSFSFVVSLYLWNRGDILLLKMMDSTGKSYPQIKISTDEIELRLSDTSHFKARYTLSFKLNLWYQIAVTVGSEVKFYVDSASGLLENNGDTVTSGCESFTSPNVSLAIGTSSTKFSYALRDARLFKGVLQSSYLVPLRRWANKGEWYS